MVNDLMWKIVRDDELKTAMISALKRCAIAIDQLEVMALEVYCNFRARPDEPDPMLYKVAACSQNFPDEIIKNNLNNLVDSRALEELKNLKTELDNFNYPADSNGDNMFQIFQEKCADFETKRKCFWNGFSDGIRRDFVCSFKALDYQEQKYLFLIVELDKEILSGYREVMEYVLGEICADLETIDAISSFLSSTFFAYKMPNKRVLIGNYVDYFLKLNELPSAEVLIELSAEKYEGSESEARIYFEGSGVTDLGILDDLGKESRVIQSENRRMIRKMMEISKEGSVHLYADRECGEGNKSCLITKLTKGEKDKGLYIKFFGYLCWSVVHDGKEKIIYERGQYRLNSSENGMEYIAKIEALKEKIGVPSMPENLLEWFESERLHALVGILKEQKHGTAVILTDCDREAERLCEVNRGILINRDIGICKNSDVMKPETWNMEQILSVTNIDGALFMDLNGTCMAIGVIVDGKALEKGDTGKGARYNSIVNYVRQKEKSSIYLGIIVSEDGMIELVCNLERNASELSGNKLNT